MTGSKKYADNNDIENFSTFVCALILCLMAIIAGYIIMTDKVLAENMALEADSMAFEAEE